MAHPALEIDQISSFYVKNAKADPFYLSFLYPRAKHLAVGGTSRVICRSQRELDSLRSLVAAGKLTLENYALSNSLALIGRITPASKTGANYTLGPFDIEQFPQLVAVLMVGAMSAGGSVDIRATECATSGGVYTDIVGRKTQRFAEEDAEENKEALLAVNAGHLGTGKRYVKFVVAVDSAPGSEPVSEPPDGTATAVLSLAVLGGGRIDDDISDIDAATVIDAV